MFYLVAYLVAFLAVAAAAVYIYLRNVLTFWKKRGVPTLENSNVLLGDFNDVSAAKISMGEKFKDIYFTFGDEPFGGVYWLFGRPILLVKDLDLVKQVFVKDFANFHSRGVYYDEKKHPIAAHLFSLDGPKWRRMRVKLTPTFTTGKIKMMFETLVTCSDQLNSFLEKEVKKNNVMDIREVVARFSTDVIASVAFGIECNSINNPDAEFRVMGRKVFEPTLMLAIRNMCFFFMHSVIKITNIGPVDPSVTKFMTKVINDTVQYRETNNVSRPDFLNLLIQMKNGQPKANGRAEVNGKEPEKDSTPISMDEVIAQAFVFFIAGYETTSSTTGFVLYELARHQDIQNKVRQEINEALKKTDGKVTYELVAQSLPYTDKVVSETLRLYPAVPFLTRQASSTVELAREPGKPPLKIYKGQTVAISVSAIQSDPKYFPNPEVFDPERFSAENSASRHSFAYIPFGEGPRICIGMRFALIQVKLGLVNILRRYSVEKCSKTMDPMRFDARSVVPCPEGGGLYVRLVPHDNLVATAS